MRYCNKTKLIINSNYKDLSIKDIVELINNAGLTKRSESSVFNYVNKLKLADIKKEEKRLKYEKWALSDPIKYRARRLLHGAKNRNKEKNKKNGTNIPFDLDLEWIVDKLNKGICEATCKRFVIKSYSKLDTTGKVHKYAPSLDQIKPGQGYTKDNVQVVCDQYNKFKGTWHVVDTLKMARCLIKEYELKHTPSIKTW